MNKLDKILYVVAPVIGVIGSVRRNEYNSPNGVPGESPTALKTADEIMSDFSIDEPEAKKRYNEQLIRVSGVIKSIQLNKGMQTIFLSTSSAVCSVICHFVEEQKGQLNQLRPWQSIVVKGVCRGMLKHVVLDKCELEDSTAIEQLARG